MCLCWFCSVVLLACASLISFESFSVDTVKTRLQGQPLPARYHGTFHAATTIIRQEGFFRGLYSGIILILCMICLRLSILFIDFILFYFILFYFFGIVQDYHKVIDLHAHVYVFMNRTSSISLYLLLPPSFFFFFLLSLLNFFFYVCLA